MTTPRDISDLQWNTLLAIADGLLPSLSDREAKRVLQHHKARVTDPEPDEAIMAFLQSRPSSNQEFLHSLAKNWNERLPEMVRGNIKLFLNIVK